MIDQFATSCVFCLIAQGAEKNHTVYEDAHHIAFLDKRPVFLGHTLLIPKPHSETLYDLPVIAVGPLFQLAQKIGKAVEFGMQAEGTFIAINNSVSQSVAHIHIHLIPRNKKDGLRGFFWPRQHYADEAHFIDVRNKIKQGLASVTNSK